jgi:hypothetical protein
MTTYHRDETDTWNYDDPMVSYTDRFVESDDYEDLVRELTIVARSRYDAPSNYAYSLIVRINTLSYLVCGMLEFYPACNSYTYGRLLALHELMVVVASSILPRENEVKGELRDDAETSSHYSSNDTQSPTRTSGSRRRSIPPKGGRA